MVVIGGESIAISLARNSGIVASIEKSLIENPIKTTLDLGIEPGTSCSRACDQKTNEANY